ncbi:LysR family transcriptional regulator [Aeromonas veronii]|uniref:LysR family transcriptional regulator n=1 Tax=Aeromonas veronii TaxID=654 RepID=UPI0019329EC1|nr:LysR family transcriptional regulator [Aeromonas veronii]MBM0418347.1 LysR family transcriptional regulator [Aeromonas veronii]MBW3789458.1 LysR family transcriptional regulator [Aeromonas veronii]
MTPSLEQLRILLAAAETGSFSAAARKLGKAQSVVSSAIANLEIDLALTLFDRSGRYPQLTEAGARMVQEAGILLAQSERLQSIAGELAAGVETRLTLAIDDDSHLPWLGTLLEKFATRYPTVELELLFPLMEDVTEMLVTGRAQLGISYQKVHPQREIVAHSLGEVTMPLVVSPDHPLARKQPLREVDLQGARQLMVTGRREGSERQRFRISAQVWWVEGDLGVLELVKRGLGWSAIPEFLLHQPLKRGEVVVLEPDFIASHALALELQWHRARPLGQAGRWLKEALLARVPR